MASHLSTGFQIGRYCGVQTAYSCIPRDKDTRVGPGTPVSRNSIVQSMKDDTVMRTSYAAQQMKCEKPLSRC